MELFSDRLGITKQKLVQLESMDEALENSIWNFLYEEILGEYAKEVAIILAREYFKQPVHEVKRLDASAWLREKYRKMTWWEAYNLFEFTVSHFPLLRGMSDKPLVEYKAYKDQSERIKRKAERILEEESSGYRFIEYKLVPISNKAETESISEALEKSRELGFDGVTAHIGKALEFISLKPKPDYRNSIKESISAVESVASLIAGQDEANLGAALNTLKQRGVYIHPTLDQAFKTLFGYTCDENGIRHAILNDSEPGFDEAKFMLVSCSAFVNFLLLKKEKTIDK